MGQISRPERMRMCDYWSALASLTDRGWAADFVGEKICLWVSRVATTPFDPVTAVPNASQNLTMQNRSRITLAAANELSYPRTRLKIIRALGLHRKKP